MKASMMVVQLVGTMVFQTVASKAVLKAVLWVLKMAVCLAS